MRFFVRVPSRDHAKVRRWVLSYNVQLSYHRRQLQTGLQNSWGEIFESVQCAMPKACDACADMGQL